MNDSPESNTHLLPDVLVIVVNWRRGQHTVECVESLLRSDYARFQIVVVDNASPDDSRDLLLQRFQGIDNVRLIWSDRNVGYAHGINQGYQAARDGAGSSGPPPAAFLWILNNDTTVEPSTMRHLAEALAADPKAGGAGALVLHHDQPDLIQTYAGTRPLTPWQLPAYLFQGKYLYHERRLPLPLPPVLTIRGHLYGASMMLREEAFRRAGGWDEKYFLEYEDVDFSRRVRRAGFRLIGVAAARVYHRIGSSKDVSGDGIQRKRFLGIPSRRYARSIEIPFYYRVRNEIRFLHQILGFWFFLLAPILLPTLTFFRILGIFVYNDTPKWPRIRLILKAVRDGLAAKMGRRNGG